MRALIGAACLAAALAASSIAAVPAQAADKLTVMLDWLVNPDHAPLIVAQEMGYFRDAGLDVTFVEPADPSDPPKLVAAGKADIALTYQPQLQMQAAAGLPLVRIGTLISTPLNTLLVLKDGPIHSIRDLKGHKIGYSVVGFEDGLLSTMLGTAGLKLSDVTLVNVNFSLVPALLSHQVDAVIGGYRNVEFNQLALQGHPARAFFPEELGVPAYDELVMAAARDRLGDPRLKRFVAAVERGVLYLTNHPRKSWALFLKHHPKLDDPLDRKAWADTLARFDHSPAALDVGRYRRFARFLVAKGIVKSMPPVADYAVDLDAPACAKPAK